MSSSASLAQLTDSELVSHVALVAGNERVATARLIAALVEFDRRKLYSGQGCSSLFTYCTDVLHLSESAAYDRIEVARVARQFPPVLERLEDGSVTLTTVRLMAPILTTDNHEALIAAATHKSKRQVELLVATVRPKPDVATVVRKLPTKDPRSATAESGCPHGASSLLPATTTVAPPPSSVSINAVVPIPTHTPPRPTLAPLSANRYKIQFTASRQLHDKLRRAQDLLRHAIPSGDPAAIFERGLDLLLAHVERQKLAKAEHPRAATRHRGRSRYIPAAVKRDVWTRDQARCAFVGPAGRCTERGFLELHHVQPYGDGGSSVVAANIELRCRAHNAYEASLYFGLDDGAAASVEGDDR
jgi:hypothetical protein